jgi:hydroxymethylbilane synthase
VALLRIGTRGSALARAQADHVADLLRASDPALEVEVEVIVVSGDRGAATSNGAPADKSRWVDAIEEGLLVGAVDVAVHSAKDVPGLLAPGLALAGAPAREDPRDALCGAGSLEELRAGARVGTGSVRRAAQLRALREDIEIAELRGNVDTRLRRLGEGGYDAIVLALAGLRRLGRESEAGARLDAERVVPAPGQGTLALEAREDDAVALRAAAAISDGATLAALEAERALVRTLDASCHTPLGAYARPISGDRGGDHLELNVFVGLPDGSAWLRDRLAGSRDRAAALGVAVGERVLAAGGGELLQRAEAMAVEGG